MEGSSLPLLLTSPLLNRDYQTDFSIIKHLTRHSTALSSLVDVWVCVSVPGKRAYTSVVIFIYSTSPDWQSVEWRNQCSMWWPPKHTHTRSVFSSSFCLMNCVVGGGIGIGELSRNWNSILYISYEYFAVGWNSPHLAWKYKHVRWVPC